VFIRFFSFHEMFKYLQLSTFHGKINLEYSIVHVAKFVI
jgi:hypothetical protein